MLDGAGSLLPEAVAVAGNLDPEDWTSLRGLAHRMLDDVLDDIAQAAEGPVWRPMPPDVRAGWQDPLPRGATDAALVYARYQAAIAPHGVGNRHPRFFGWVHGMAGGPSSGCSPRCSRAG